MNIVGGKLRGRKLVAPRAGLRPTSERVRESVFNILAPVMEGTRVLDLFAGTGALGLEALSQGAAECVFVEQSRIQIKSIRENLNQLFPREASTSQVVEEDVFTWLKRPRPGGPFPVIFADPPYENATAHVADLLDRLPESGILAPVSLLIFEGHKRMDPVEKEGWELLRDRTYGLTRVHIYRYHAAAEQDAVSSP